MQSTATLARSRPLVICLHASASTSRQWQPLADDLGNAFEVATPDLLGHGDAVPWRGKHAGVLLADVTRVLAIAGSSARRIHLVGHSYGGAVALRAALLDPDRFTT